MPVPKRSQSEVWYTRKMTQIWHESPMYFDALKAAKIAPNQYRCAGCSGIFKLREVEVDHMNPKVDPNVGWVSCADYAKRLNCPASELQILCEDKCHLEKTRNENKRRI